LASAHLVELTGADFMIAYSHALLVPSIVKFIEILINVSSALRLEPNQASKFADDRHGWNSASGAFADVSSGLKDLKAVTGMVGNSAREFSSGTVRRHRFTKRWKKGEAASDLRILSPLRQDLADLFESL
jgi:hypothetical protein